MPRLFVAIPMPADVTAELSRLCVGLPAIRWMDEDTFHLTLRFIGEVEGWRADEVDEALSSIRCRPFDLSLRGVGTFEKAGKIETLWVGVEKHATQDVRTRLEGAALGRLDPGGVGVGALQAYGTRD